MGIFDDRIIAYLQWYEHDPFAVVISRLKVLKGFRRCGYGRQLVEDLLADQQIQLVIASGVLIGAVAFWESLGFRRVVEQEDYENDSVWSKEKV